MPRFSLLLLALCVASPATAAQWVLVPEKSRIGFSASQGGDPFTGSFPGFTTRIDFDPDAPEKGHIEATIPLARVSVEGKDRQEAITGEDWFNIGKFPEARFVSRSITRGKEAGQYVAEGDLTLKGVTQPVTLPFTLNVAGNEATAKGTLTLKRNLFKVGTGDFAGEDWIGHDVKIDVTIVATK